MNAIEVFNLSKSFRVGFWSTPKQVLFDISFAVPQGSISGFIGGNGQGKTTTLKCIMQFLFPEKGEIKIFGESISDFNRNRMGYLPERPYLYEYLTAEDFLNFHWNLSQKSPSLFSVACDEALEKVDLLRAKKQRIRSFSKGMMQRLSLAQALLHHPELLILDEPMSGLDPDGRWLVKQILSEQRSKGTTIFFSSHLLQDMDELCDHLIVIDQGKIKFTGKPTEFKAHHRHLEEAFSSLRRSSQI